MQNCKKKKKKNPVRFRSPNASVDTMPGRRISFDSNKSTSTFFLGPPRTAGGSFQPSWGPKYIRRHKQKPLHFFISIHVQKPLKFSTISLLAMLWVSGQIKAFSKGQRWQLRRSSDAKTLSRQQQPCAGYLQAHTLHLLDEAIK